MQGVHKTFTCSLVEGISVSNVKCHVMTFEGASKGPVRGTVRERGGREGGAL